MSDNERKRSWSNRMTINAAISAPFSPPSSWIDKHNAKRNEKVNETTLQTANQLTFTVKGMNRSQPPRPRHPPFKPFKRVKRGHSKLKVSLVLQTSRLQRAPRASFFHPKFQNNGAHCRLANINSDTPTECHSAINHFVNLNLTSFSLESTMSRKQETKNELKVVCSHFQGLCVVWAIFPSTDETFAIRNELISQWARSDQTVKCLRPADRVLITCAGAH